MKTTNRAAAWVWGVALAMAIAPRPAASAQAALVPVLVQSSSGLCLAVAPPTGTAAGSPGVGWRVIVASCDGSRRQRWGQVVGDYSDFVFTAGVCIGPAAQGRPTLELVRCEGTRDVVGHVPPVPDGTGTLRVGERCVTAPSQSGPPEPTLLPCDGRPGQIWRTSQRRP